MKSEATYRGLLPIPELSRRQLLRFESNILEDECGCWLWTGYKNHGAGYFKIGGKAYFAHRVMFAEAFGRAKIDSSMAIRTCGRRDCLNPDHIELGDCQELADIRKATGKYAGWNGSRAGDRNPNAKLALGDVLAVREAEGSLTEVGERFGLSPGYVWRLKVGRAWPHAQGMSGSA